MWQGCQAGSLLRQNTAQHSPTHQLRVVGDHAVLLVVQHGLAGPVEGAVDQQPPVDDSKLVVHVRLRTGQHVHNTLLIGWGRLLLVLVLLWLLLSP